MRAVVITEPGDSKVLSVKARTVPDVGPGQVRVRVAAFGVNRADLLQRRGQYPAPPGWPEDIPGLEYAGVIDELGSGASGLAVGDRVMGIVGGGSYAEYVVTHAAHVVPVPTAMDLVEAAAVPEVFFTAFDALERLTVTANEWVLVHAVGSGVGSAAIQLIRARGGHSIGTSRTPSKLDRAKLLGMHSGIDTESEELISAVRHIAPDGVHAVVDLLGGPLLAATLQTLRPLGRLILVGLTGGRRADLDLGLLLRLRLRIEGTVLRARSVAEKTQLTRSFVESVLPMLESGTVSPVVDRVFPLDEVRAAHDYLESNASFGKVVVRID